MYIFYAMCHYHQRGCHWLETNIKIGQKLINLLIWDSVLVEACDWEANPKNIYIYFYIYLQKLLPPIISEHLHSSQSCMYICIYYTYIYMPCVGLCCLLHKQCKIMNNNFSRLKRIVKNPGRKSLKNKICNLFTNSQFIPTKKKKKTPLHLITELKCNKRQCGVCTKK